MEGQARSKKSLKGPKRSRSDSCYDESTRQGIAGSISEKFGKATIISSDEENMDETKGAVPSSSSTTKADVAISQPEAQNQTIRETTCSSNRAADADSSFYSDGVDEREQNEAVQLIKAKTMFEMVDDVIIDDSACKLLLLSNAQANHLAQSRTFDKLLAALEIKEYSCVINLLESGGFTQSLIKWHPDKSGLSGRDKIFAGLVPDRPAFASKKEEREAVERIDIFMEQVIVPLAIDTKAIVITRAIFGDSILSESFTRVYRIMRSRFVEKDPFHVISIADQLLPLYAHPEFSKSQNRAAVHWMKVKNASKTWRSRHKMICNVASLYWGQKKNNERMWDLDPYATCYVLGEGINNRIESVEDGKISSQPFNRFMSVFTSYLSCRVPALALATGFTEKRMLNENFDRSLAYPLSLAQANNKVLLLDVRRRTAFNTGMLKTGQVVLTRSDTWKSTRSSLTHCRIDAKVDELLEFAKKQHALACDQLLKQGLAECFDICTLAYFKSMLGNNEQDGVGCFGFNQDDTCNIGHTEPKPLHEAVAAGLARKQATSNAHTERTSGENDLERIRDEATSYHQLIGEIASWIAHKTFKDAFEVLPNTKKIKTIESCKSLHETIMSQMRDEDLKSQYDQIVKNLAESFETTPLILSTAHQTQTEVALEEPYEILYKERIFAMETWARGILSSASIAVANLHDLEDTKQLVSSLLHTNRLPKQNTFEGLQLIHQAWMDHDVATHLALYYKVMSKILFTLQLITAWLAVFASSLFPEETGFVFTLTALCGMLVPIEALFSSNARWRHMRSSAGELHSMIWCYRTRVGDFELDPALPRRPDLAFNDALNAWRDELMSGANVDKSTMAKEYGDYVYKHQQKPPGRPKPTRFKDITGKLKEELECDDNYSPQGPYQYIERRLLPALQFYQKRIPYYGHQCIVTRLLIVACAVAASFLTKYNKTIYVATVTAFGSGVTSWSEYTDAEKKLIRYTRVVRDLQRHLNWWRTLTDLEEKCTDNIRVLVIVSEEIISQERLGWAARKRILRTDPTSQTSDAKGVADDFA